MFSTWLSRRDKKKNTYSNIIIIWMFIVYILFSDFFRTSSFWNTTINIFNVYEQYIISASDCIQENPLHNDGDYELKKEQIIYKRYRSIKTKATEYPNKYYYQPQSSGTLQELNYKIFRFVQNYRTAGVVRCYSCCIQIICSKITKHLEKFSQSFYEKIELIY